MKVNLTPGPEDGPEREALRAFLRHWHVAGPPQDIEEDLRRTFRRRRSGRRPVVWLALAAGLALVVLSQAVPTGRPLPPERPVAAAPPQLALPAPPPSDRGADRTAEVAAARTPRARRAPDSSPGERDVIVEPGQAELLAQLGRRLRDVRDAIPGTAVPRVETLPAGAPDLPIPDMRVTDLPLHRNQWEEIAGEWPSVYRSVPDMEVRE